MVMGLAIGGASIKHYNDSLSSVDHEAPDTGLLGRMYVEKGATVAAFMHNRKIFCSCYRWQGTLGPGVFCYSSYGCSCVWLSANGQRPRRQSTCFLPIIEIASTS
jgi:hypothetical protein